MTPVAPPAADEPDLRVLVTDHERAMAEALAQSMAADRRMGLVQVAASLREVASALRSDRPDVVLVHDDRACGLTDGVLAMTATGHPEVAVVVLSGDDQDGHLAERIAAGARGWVSAEADVDHVCRAVRAVVDGQWWVPRGAFGQVVRDLTAPAASPAAALATLTSRERQVLDALADGMSRTEIARHLSLSVNTVRTHVQHLLRRLGVHTTLEAVSVVLRERAGARPPVSARPPRPSPASPSSAR